MREIPEHYSLNAVRLLNMCAQWAVISKEPGEGTFRTYSKYLKDHFGPRYAQLMRYLANEDWIEIEYGTERRGRTRRYRLKYAPDTHALPIPEKVVVETVASVWDDHPSAVMDRQFHDSVTHESFLVRRRLSAPYSVTHKEDRSYTALNMMSKELRTGLTDAVTGEPIVELDMANAHAAFWVKVLRMMEDRGPAYLEFYSDKGQRRKKSTLNESQVQEWQEVVSTGTLHSSMAYASDTTPDISKSVFLKMVNTEGRIYWDHTVDCRKNRRNTALGWQQSDTYKTYGQVFGSLLRLATRLRMNPTTSGQMRLNLLAVEASIFRSSELVGAARQAGIAFGQTHDGVMVKQSDSERLIALVQDRVLGVLGFPVLIRVKAVKPAPASNDCCVVFHISGPNVESTSIRAAFRSWNKRQNPPPEPLTEPVQMPFPHVIRLQPPPRHILD